MSTMNNGSTASLPSFWDVFAWENRDRRLDDFPMMQSPVWPIGKWDKMEYSVDLTYININLIPCYFYSVSQFLSFFVFFYQLYGPHQKETNSSFISGPHPGN